METVAPGQHPPRGEARSPLSRLINLNKRKGAPITRTSEARPYGSSRSIANASADLDVLAKAIGPMSDDDPAVAVVVVVMLVIIAVPVRTNVDTVRTDAELHGVCRRYRRRAQGDQRGQRQNKSLHRHLLSESYASLANDQHRISFRTFHGRAASKLNASQQMIVPIGCHRVLELPATGLAVDTVRAVPGGSQPPRAVLDDHPRPWRAKFQQQPARAQAYAGITTGAIRHSAPPLRIASRASVITK